MREALRRYIAGQAHDEQLQRLKIAVETLRGEAKATPAGKLTTRETDAEIKAAREQRRQRQALKQPAPMIRVVLDTNVLFSAAPKRAGAPTAVFDLVIAGTLTPCASETVLAEYYEVLNRPVLQLHSVRDREVLELLALVAVSVTPTVNLSVCTDPDDNIFLECAEAAEADFLVTGNLKHHPADKRWKTTQIVTPRQLLDSIAAQFESP